MYPPLSKKWGGYVPRSPRIYVLAKSCPLHFYSDFIQHWEYDMITFGNYFYTFYAHQFYFFIDINYFMPHIHGAIVTYDFLAPSM